MDTAQFAFVSSFVGSFLVVVVTGLAIIWIKRRQRSNPDPQSEMYAAWQRYCDALDEAALDGDTARYDRIKKVGWRNYGLTPSR